MGLLREIGQVPQPLQRAKAEYTGTEPHRLTVRSAFLLLDRSDFAMRAAGGLSPNSATKPSSPARLPRSQNAQTSISSP